MIERLYETKPSTRKWKVFKVCISCGKRFEVKHQLRLHCNMCRPAKLNKGDEK